MNHHNWNYVKDIKYRHCLICRVRQHEMREEYLRKYFPTISLKEIELFIESDPCLSDDELIAREIIE
jgi:hypothetical protein